MTRRTLLTALLAAVPANGVSWLKLDLLSKTRTGDWPDVQRLVSFGSLLKPFLVLAFSHTHAQFPRVFCHGARDRCWLAKGHGEQDVVSALANSCNCYFLHLASLLDRAALDAVCLSYGLALPSRALKAEALMGLGSGWRNTPLAVVTAFSQVTDSTVLSGMAECAKRGTGKNLHLSCYAKTGTAPCSHTPAEPGDGFVVVLYPTGQPRTVLLLEHHGKSGAEACRAVRGKMYLH